MTIQKQYDFIVVGSGMGGLTTAVILAKNNFSVLVLEKNHQIGGALQVFSRDKCVFDTGVHYIGGLDEGENLNLMFRYLEIYDKLKLQSLDREGFDKIRLPSGKFYQHAQGYEKFEEKLVESFPDETSAIAAFIQKMKEICAFFPLYNLAIETEKNYLTSPEILELGAWDYVESITENQELREVLLGSGMLYAGDRKSTPMYVVALIMNSYICGSYRLVDGGSQIAKSLSKVLHRYGGEILKHKEVVGAEYSSTKEITSIKCSDGTEYFAKNYVSNLHPSLTINVFGENNFRRAFRDRIANLPNTVSSFMVYFSLKEKSMKYKNHNVYEHFTNDFWNDTDYNLENWPQTLYLSTPASSKSKEYAESICVMAYMSIEEVKNWENTFNTISNPSERDKAYHDFKKSREELVILRMESRYPEFRSQIKNIYSSTPLTYKDYIGTPGGSLYGIMKDFRKPLATSINTKTRVPNLFLTGQNIIFHGILGAAIGAFVTCFNFLDAKEIIPKIKEHEYKL